MLVYGLPVPNYVENVVTVQPDTSTNSVHLFSLNNEIIIKNGLLVGIELYSSSNTTFRLYVSVKLLFKFFI